MAYMNQDKKRQIGAILKGVVPPGWKYSLAVANHSAIVMTIRAAPVDFIQLRIAQLRKAAEGPCPDDVRRSWLAEQQHLADGSRGCFRIWEDSVNDFPDEVAAILRRIFAALNADNYDRSDVMTDYFDVGHYVTLRVGADDKPFRHLAA